MGIATATDGSVLVADRGNKRIQIFDENGKYITTIPTKSGERPVTPVDVAVDKGGKHIFVTATKPFHQILVYGEGAGKGEAEQIWGKPGSNLGEFRFPATITVGKDNNVYIVDVFNSRIQVYRDTGKPLITISSWGVTPGHLFRPKGVAVNDQGLIAVSDSYLGVVQLFTDDTRFQAVLGENGEFAHFTTPAGLALDNDGRLYIAEMLANKVTVLELVR
ncbi:MAG: NHL repeat-containing protein [Gammaproteobacteria bacterium]|nr:NHL repeat-containing protein [Gammaproteobacteria bacterium]